MQVFLQLLVIFLAVQTVAATPPPPAQPGEVAYVVVGDLEQNLVNQMAYGDAYKRYEPLIQKRIQELKAAGYIIGNKGRPMQSITKDLLRRILQNPRTAAVAWFGHGDREDPGSLTIFGPTDEAAIRKAEQQHFWQRKSSDTREVIGTQQLRIWAQEKLALRKGWDGKGDVQDWPNNRDDLSLVQQNQLRQQLNKASIGLKYGFFFTCHGLDKTEMLDALMRKDASTHAYGFRGVKRGFDESGLLQAAALQGKWQIDSPAVIEPKRAAAEAAIQAVTSIGPSGSANAGEKASSLRGDSPPLEKKHLGVPPASSLDNRAVSEKTSLQSTDKTSSHKDPGQPFVDTAPEEDEVDEEIDIFTPPASTADPPKAQTRNRKPPATAPPARHSVEESDGEIDITDTGDSQAQDTARPDSGPGNHQSSTAGLDKPVPVDKDIAHGGESFDGQYTCTISTAEPTSLTLTINGGAVVFRMDILRIPGQVTAIGHVTAHWQGVMGQIDNPNEGALQGLLDIHGDIHFEGDLSGKLVNGRATMATQVPRAGRESEQKTVSSWSCIRDS